MIRAIAAIDQQMGIGKKGRQPWKLPEDETYFRSQTLSHGANVLMGRRTYDAISHPLVGRTNHVVSRIHPQEVDEQGVVWESSIVPFLESCLQKDQDLWLIGGAEVYTQALPFVEELYLTEIMETFHCDTFFPVFAPFFKETFRSTPHVYRGIRYEFVVYRRRSLK